MLLFPDVIQLLDALHIRNCSKLDNWYSSLVLVGKAQAYIPKRHTLIQVLPSANAYTKYSRTPPPPSANTYGTRTDCSPKWGPFVRRGRHSMRILLVYGQVTKEFAYGKYLNECTLFGYVSL